MPRREKDPPKLEEKVTAAWEAQRQGIDAACWKFGGPMIPVDEIEPVTYQPGWVGQHIKVASTRLRHAMAELARVEKDLADSTAYYLDLAGRGIDALKFDYHRQSDRDMDARSDKWANVPRNVDMHRASCFNQIRGCKGRIAACKRAIDDLERPAYPLLTLRDDA